MRTNCLGPYSITCSSLEHNGEYSFIDNNKSKRKVVITPCGAIESPPEPDAIILHEVLNCPQTNCDIRWYECPSSMGRVYTVFPTACEVVITNFENGLVVSNDCDASSFGAKTFCFGKLTDQNGDSQNIDDCKSIFEFDGNTFKVEGTLTEDTGVFDCSSCSEDLEFTIFAGDPPPPGPDDSGEEEIPDPPSPPSLEDVDDTQDTRLDNDEDRIIWTNRPEGDSETGLDLSCTPEESLGEKDVCESQDNPSIATLNSGHMVVAYQDRDVEGNTSIKLKILNSSVPVKIVYYRSLSFGRLINNDSFEYGAGSFEVYDDIRLDLTENRPTTPTVIGFLNGPLAGEAPFEIETVERTLQDDGRRFKHLIRFNSNGRSPEFLNGNDAYDVSFFIAETAAGLPGGTQLDTLIDVPPHLDAEGNAVPMSNPSIDVAKNNTMIDTTQNLYLTYQAFLNNQWNVYAIHIRINETGSESPTYSAPYLFEPPTSTSASLSGSEFDLVQYTVVESKIENNVFCALFEVSLEDGRPIFNCAANVSGTFTTTLCNFEADLSKAVVEIGYSLINPASCSSNVPTWTVGTTITGEYPPTPTILLAGEGSTACVIGVNEYPDTNEWCYNENVCTQYYVFDDPYCPSPYTDLIEFTYQPADLWTIKNGDDFVTRVLYNMSASVTQTLNVEGIQQELDFMFVIDHSASMSQEIDRVRNAVPGLVSQLKDQGFDVRIGFVAYGRGPTGTPQPTTFIDCDGTTSRIFDGLQAEASCSLSGVPGGFTKDVPLFQSHLDCWGIVGGAALHYPAIQFAIEDAQFAWRENSAKYMLLVTDTDDTEGPTTNICNGYTKNKQDAINSLVNNGVVFLAAVCVPPSAGGTCTTGQSGKDGSVFADLVTASGWDGRSLFDVNADDYGVLFDEIARNIIQNLSGLRVLERDEFGYNPTFMKPAEVLITYRGDLSDLWTYNRENFTFQDVPPTGSGPSKGITNTPFRLYDGRIFNVDQVFNNGNTSNWTYYISPGDFTLNYPNIGVPESSRSDPILIAENATRPRIKVGNRNNVYVAYEIFSTGIPQIEIKGTGDLHYNSIVGPAGGRITKITQSSDFKFSHEITLNGEGVNQLCDFIVDKSDITHITWQSNRDSVWEIYYANSCNQFQPIRITKHDSRSSNPRIDVDDSGNIYIVYHDNRFDRYEAMLAFKDERRVLPLTQQDAYLASLRNNYTHYTNVLPVLVSNVGTEIPTSGLLWATKMSTGEGNAEEGYIFAIDDPLTGNKGKGGNTIYDIAAIAGSRDGFMYGFTESADLLLLDSPSEDPYLDIETSDISVIGSVSLSTQSGLGSVVFQDLFNRVDGTPFNIDGDYIDVCSSASNIICLDPSVNAVICDSSIATCAGCSGSGHTNCGNGGTSPNIEAPVVAVIADTQMPTDSMTVVVNSLWETTTTDTRVTGGIFNLYARCQSNTIANCYQAKFQEVNGDIQTTIIYKNGADVAGVGIQLGTVTTSTPWSVGTSAELRLDAYDNVDGSVTITAYVNEIAVLSVNDDQYKPSGRYGGFSLITGFFNAFSSNFTNIKVVLEDFTLRNFVSPSDEVTSKILDCTFDNVNRLWLLISETPVVGNASMKILEIEPSNANILRETTVFNNITSLKGGITSLNNGVFYLTVYTSGVPKLYKSSYPITSGQSAVFQFEQINNNMSINVEAITSDENDVIYAIDSDNKLYNLSLDFGLSTLLSDLSIADTSDPYFEADPIGDIAGLGYQFSGVYEITGERGFFHVRIEFYDNIGLLGDPAVVIDSRDQLEAFINMETLDDPYVGDAYFAGASGIFLEVGDSGFVFFDASHSRPGKEGLAYPYRFDTNQTYFPKVFIIGPSSSEIQEVEGSQTTSFSCNKCTSLGDNSFDSQGCSFSFVLEDPGKYNLLIDFFGDPAYTNLLTRFRALYGEADLALMEVDNDIASNSWEEDGLRVLNNKPKFVQIYPGLDPNSGLLCGVTYYVKVTRCDGVDCTNPATLTELLFARGEFRCDCSSNIFNDKVRPLSQISRWNSSANGFSDTRITDSPDNSLRPVIKTRSSGAAIVLFEDYNDPNGVKVKGSTFRKSSPNELFGSGTRSWFDYDFNMDGRDVDIAVDLYDRVSSVYEKPDAVNGKGVSNQELPGNQIFTKNCDFDEIGSQEREQKCDISELTSSIITSDEFISSQLIKRMLIKESDVKYYTHNASGSVSPVVNTCDVTLQIWGTPESVAFRVRNEDESTYSNWCPFNTEISDYFTEYAWKLSPVSGVKQVCVQVMTYSGVTSEFCIIVVADYQPVIFEIKMYGEDPAANPEAESLPLHEGLFVASTLYDIAQKTTNREKIIYIDIVPNEEISVDNINFDVIQQGENDLLDLSATKTTDAQGRQVYRGSFLINKEDNIVNKDGLARIRARFPGVCEVDTFVAALSTFNKEKFNVSSGDSQAEVTETVVDPLEDFRQGVSGKIGTGMPIRPTEDPYFVFGSPDFFLKDEEPSQKGVSQPKED